MSAVLRKRNMSAILRQVTWHYTICYYRSHINASYGNTCDQQKHFYESDGMLSAYQIVNYALLIIVGLVFGFLF